MVKVKIVVLLMILPILSSLFACVAAPLEHSDASSQMPVEDLFNVEESQGDPTDDSDATEEATDGGVDFPRITSFGYGPGRLSDDEQDVYGWYFVYEGGQMHISLEFGGEKLRMEGVGALLFLDGIPQPYATSEGGELSYMHTFYPKGAARNEFKLYFTPITGVEGDVKELNFLLVTDPDYSNESGKALPFRMKRGYAAGVRFEATPPAQETPPLEDYLVSWSAEYADLSSGDVVGWTTADYTEEVRHSVIIDGYENVGISYETTKDDLIPVHFELMGAPSAEFSVVILFDNMPVSVVPEDLIFVHAEQGKKIIVEALIDFRDFDGASEISVVVVPRNWCDQRLGTSCEIWCYDGYWFVDDPTPENYSRR